MHQDETLLDVIPAHDFCPTCGDRVPDGRHECWALKKLQEQAGQFREEERPPDARWSGEGNDYVRRD
jgi:hypothetical protein